MTHPETMKLLFAGDIMGHDTQIAEAYDSGTRTYNYDSVFHRLTPIFNEADFTIANLEVTLAGKPYKGYPSFSSPDALAEAAQSNGIDVLVTANNHSIDRGRQGVDRTLDVLDSLDIPHTGTFRDTVERDSSNLLVLEKGTISVGILNYTYGTNEIPTTPPNVVNRIDRTIMLQDIEKSRNTDIDKLIIVIHWGEEYNQYPIDDQTELAQFLFENGVDIIIGSHPHVIQQMEYQPASDTSSEQIVVYSLGNFVSNQRTRPRDGGAMFELTLTKDNNGTQITDHGYYLTWVHKPIIDGERRFEIVPCSMYEAMNYPSMSHHSITQMDIFTRGSRKLLGDNNHNISEKSYWVPSPEEISDIREQVQSVAREVIVEMKQSINSSYK